MTEQRHAGTYVRDARTKAKMRQVDLSAAAGISQPYLSQVEKGARPLTVRGAWAIERALDLDPDTLVRWAEDVPATLRKRVTGTIPGLLNCLLLTPLRRTSFRPASAPSLQPAW